MLVLIEAGHRNSDLSTNELDNSPNQIPRTVTSSSILTIVMVVILRTMSQVKNRREPFWSTGINNKKEKTAFSIHNEAKTDINTNKPMFCLLSGKLDAGFGQVLSGLYFPIYKFCGRRPSTKSRMISIGSAIVSTNLGPDHQRIQVHARIHEMSDQRRVDKKFSKKIQRWSSPLLLSF